ncbi:MAG TPA: ZIP family metal transporter [Solirubrobacteraceae bacterium]|nr:ZIP family metal transporter [Solirubrobacteraceae bacterium]
MRFGRVPAWVLGALPLLLAALAIGGFAALGGPGLGDRTGPAVEELAFERTVLRPGEIVLHVRNDGPDPVRVAQVSVNDAFTQFDMDGQEIGRLGSREISVEYPWVEGEAYEVSLLTSTGTALVHEIDAAVETPETDLSFLGLLALLGVYVGVIPVALGMLWLPFVGRVGEGWVRVLMAVTVGLLGFLALDATVEAVEIAGAGAAVLGGVALPFVGAALAYLALTGVDAHLRARRGAAQAAGASGATLALLVAVGIGLHNLGEGLAIGSAYAIGALALGAFLVVGFAIHNTTEGLAIVAPLAGERPPLRRLAGLGLIAGAPAILGAWIGAVAFNPALAAFMLGAGAGAIAQVIVQIVPSLRDRAGRALTPATVAGIAAGAAVLYATGLLVTV